MGKSGVNGLMRVGAGNRAWSKSIKINAWEEAKPPVRISGEVQCRANQNVDAERSENLQGSKHLGEGAGVNGHKESWVSSRATFL